MICENCKKGFKKGFKNEMEITEKDLLKDFHKAFNKMNAKSENYEEKNVFNEKKLFSKFYDFLENNKITYKIKNYEESESIKEEINLENVILEFNNILYHNPKILLTETEFYHHIIIENNYDKFLNIYQSEYINKIKVWKEVTV